jgi:hypothetical protein
VTSGNQNATKTSETLKSAERLTSNRSRSLEAQVDAFMQQLKSTRVEDVRSNAEIFGDLLVSFSATFDTDMERLLSVVLDDKSQSINMASLRSQLKKLVSE